MPKSPDKNTFLNLDVFVQRPPPNILRHKMSLLCSRTCNLALGGVFFFGDWPVKTERIDPFTFRCIVPPLSTTHLHSSVFLNNIFLFDHSSKNACFGRKLGSPLNIAAIVVARSAGGKNWHLNAENSAGSCRHFTNTSFTFVTYERRKCLMLHKPLYVRSSPASWAFTIKNCVFSSSKRKQKQHTQTSRWLQHNWILTPSSLTAWLGTMVWRGWTWKKSG